jgi:TolB-like protein/DNA-binding winged helix-turn-helix (wHTH) protein/Tfp pilus assembly protein PilF
MDFKTGFQLGDWLVYPLEGRLVGQNEETRVQPKSMDVLLRLAEAGGALAQRDDILRDVWGERAVSDEPLTRCVGELRRALGDTRAEPEYIVTIPKRGYRLLKEVKPLPVDDEQDVSAAAEAAQHAAGTRKKVAVGLLVIVAAALVETVFERILSDSDLDFGGSETQEMVLPSDKPSIAVLPFVNLSGSQENEYFSDGLTETVLYTLARLPNLLVAARTSSFVFKDTIKDVRDIATELGVSHVLEGSVQRSGNRIRVTAQLVRSNDGFHLWSESYDENVDDVFKVQDEISAKVSIALLGTFRGNSAAVSTISVDTLDPAAYDHYLMALNDIRLISFESLQRAENHLIEALEIDDGFTEARVSLGHLFIDQAYTGMKQWPEVMPRAQQQADELFRSASPGLQAEGLQATIDGYDAIREFDRARIGLAAGKLARIIEQRPNSIWLNSWLSLFQLQTGDVDLALATIERGLTRDPLSGGMHSKRGEALYALGRYEDAARAFARVRELQPNMPGGYSSGGTVAQAYRHYESYVPLMLRAMELDPVDHELPARFAGTLYSLGLVEEAEPWYQRSVELAPDAPATRRFGLDRSWWMGDMADLRERAETMLIDRVENRVASVFAATMFYVHAKRQLGEIADVPEFVAQLSPHVVDPQQQLSLSRDYWLKLALIDALFILDPELAKEHATFADSYVRQAFPVFAREPRPRAALRVAMNQREEAIRIALDEDLVRHEVARGISGYPSDIYRFFATLGSIADDPEIAARLAEIEQVQSADAENVRRLLIEHGKTSD